MVASSQLSSLSSLSSLSPLSSLSTPLRSLTQTPVAGPCCMLAKRQSTRLSPGWMPWFPKRKEKTVASTGGIAQSYCPSSSPSIGNAVSRRILSLSNCIFNSSFTASRSSSLFRAPLRSNNLASLSAFNLRSSSRSRWIHLSCPPADVFEASSLWW